MQWNSKSGNICTILSRIDDAPYHPATKLIYLPNAPMLNNATHSSLLHPMKCTSPNILRLNFHLSFLSSRNGPTHFIPIHTNNLLTPLSNRFQNLHFPLWWNNVKLCSKNTRLRSFARSPRSNLFSKTSRPCR